MFEIKGRRIRLTRGDTAEILIRAEGVTFEPEDRAIFTVKEEADERRPKVEKMVTPAEDGLCTILLESGDTADMRPGAYVWDIRFALGCTLDEAGEIQDAVSVITPFAPQTFEVLEAVGEV